jgi:hypothetical protein
MQAVVQVRLRVEYGHAEPPAAVGFDALERLSQRRGRAALRLRASTQQAKSGRRTDPQNNVASGRYSGLLIPAHYRGRH